MRTRFNPTTPFYLWTVAGGFAFFESEANRDAALEALPADTLHQVGKLPAEEVGRITPHPDPHNLIGAPVCISIPGPMFAALWDCSARNDIRWYLSGGVMLHGSDAYATDGRVLVRKTDSVTRLRSNAAQRVLVHLDAWIIPLLREKTVVEVLDTGIVRVSRRRKRGNEVIAMGSQIARGLVSGAEPLPAPWPTIETMFADIFNEATVEGLSTPVSNELLARAVTAAGLFGGHADAVVFRSNPDPKKGVAWVSAGGAAGVIMPMRLNGNDTAGYFERYGLKPPAAITADERDELEGEG